MSAPLVGALFLCHKEDDMPNTRPINRPINFRLSDKLRERLNAEAQHRGIGPGELLRLLIAQSCQSAEEENSKTTKDRERTYAK
jgi:hypothetical protein